MAERIKNPKRPLRRGAEPSLAGAGPRVAPAKRPSGEDRLKSTLAADPVENRFHALEQECKDLKAALAEAETRAAALESAQTDVINRIDWIIDSLHTLRRDED